MLEEILKPILGEYGELGFELSEADDHDLELKYRGQTIAMTVGPGIRDKKQLEAAIQDSCREHLNLMARADNLARREESESLIPQPIY